ncbi:sugar kinase [Lichenihabitans sp. Uapishka_5]|uniref:tagatose kinase n=1 Tax=Lichenihabitans sp. Uapishka_5 TaxID=3037302 RepID=UPI0029E7EAC8|nr:sugar kinase [Lichenihabitans sp. Uapishka_5]MDX7950799.1 sugar kinase [Lichenihabitans sp. Uapishka_5]
MKRIVAIGEILVEIMAAEPGEGFREPLALTGPFPSGAPAIFADQAARFGQPAAMIGCVGDDDFGRVNLDRLSRDGVDISGIRIDPEAATGSAFVRYRADGSRAFVFNITHSASGRIVFDSAARAVLEQSHHLHVMGTALFAPAIVEVVLEAASLIKGRGGTISFDPNLRLEMLNLSGLRAACEALFRRCDLFLPSGTELTLFTDTEDEDAAIAEILAHGVSAVVHKKGVMGASYYDATTRLTQPGFAVDEVDPTGAGDSFGATFVSCWLRGMPPGTCLAYAAASGALAVTKLGPMEGASTEAEIKDFLADRNKRAAP